MKQLSAVLLAFLVCACHSSTTTEINRPPLDTTGTRTLVLKTFSDGNFEARASASYATGNSKGFGPGVFITCNSFPVIDTRVSSFENDTTVFINFTDTSYDWVYRGPDTTMEWSEPSLGDLFIISPRSDTEIFLFNTFDSLLISYQPMGACSNLKLLLTSEGTVLDSLSPTITFDTATGAIDPVPVDSISTLSGNGSIAIAVVRRTAFSIPSIHSVVVEDSTISEANTVFWEQ